MGRTSLNWRRALAVAAFYVFGALSSDQVVDDADTRIRYSPSEHWSQGASCENCALHPSPPEAQDGTWHDTTFDPENETGPFSASFTFTGNRVKVYAILPPDSANNPQVLTTHTDVIFLLDNVDQQAPFQNDPPVGSGFLYHQLIFDSGTVIYGDHTLTVQLSEDVASVLLLDYIVYTVPDPTSSSLVLNTATSGESTVTVSVTTTKSQSAQATVASSPSTPAEQSPTPLVLSGTALPSSDVSLSNTAVSSFESPTESSHLPSRSDTLTSSSPASSSTPTSSNATGDGAEPKATTESTGSSTNSIPATTVIAAAAAGSIALLILLGAIIYLACVRHARKRSVTGTDHAELPEEDGQQRFTELPPELYPSLATQARLLGHTHKPFADPGAHPRHADMVMADPPLPRLPSNGGSAVAHAPSDDSPDLLPTPRSSIQSAATAPTSPTVSPSALARPESRPTTLVSRSHLDTSTDKLSMAGGSESHDDCSALCETLASTLPEVPTRPNHEGVDTAPVSNPNHTSWLTADARVLEQLAALKDEVARIRARQEALPVEAPPRYDEVR
ncbi:hypothetical protein GY45DRAFT_1284894 [Cubamyces sp. BRFM 1775]|nr:hypothetical protein GY45DRAFT_1284894 [Cubamyces sp. BRFM 1775]